LRGKGFIPGWKGRYKAEEGQRDVLTASGLNLLTQAKVCLILPSISAVDGRELLDRGFSRDGEVGNKEEER
jgi:hypothetical protein